MKKLKLNLDEIKVQSFDVDIKKTGENGTVIANALESNTCSPKDTCINGFPTCHSYICDTEQTNWESCQIPTCVYTCVNDSCFGRLTSDPCCPDL